MRRLFAMAVVLAAASATSAQSNPTLEAIGDRIAQSAEGWADMAPTPVEPKMLADRGSLKRLNRKLQGRVLDYTRNHGRDNRIRSAVLGECRDTYVYIPPCYDPRRQYSMLLWLHGAFGDEHVFISGGELVHLDQLILKGLCPPVVVVCPDGTYEGTNSICAQHSFFINGMGGAFEDYLFKELIPWTTTNFSIRPEREAHAITGTSAGGFASVSLGIRHRDYFAVVSALAPPVNMRYGNTKNRYFANFKPQTYRARTEYNPRQTVGRFFGLLRLRSSRLLEDVFGPPDQLIYNIVEYNPADLLFTQNLQPGELAIYLNYCRLDNFNFDAHVESFVWLANQRGIQIDVEKHPWAQHLVPYFHRAQREAYGWLAPRLMPPTEIPETTTSDADNTAPSK